MTFKASGLNPLPPPFFSSKNVVYFICNYFVFKTSLMKSPCKELFREIVKFNFYFFKLTMIIDFEVFPMSVYIFKICINLFNKMNLELKKNSVSVLVTETNF